MAGWKRRKGKLKPLREQPQVRLDITPEQKRTLRILMAVWDETSFGMTISRIIDEYLAEHYQFLNTLGTSRSPQETSVSK